MRESGEMYLETILVLHKTKSSVRAIDVADEMKLSKASVSRALSILRDDECITVETDGNILFTPKGKAIAQKIYERHLVLTEAIASLGVDKETAAADACKIEHVISDETFEAIKKTMESK